MPNPNTLQNQIPAWGPSRYTSKAALVRKATQYARIHTLKRTQRCSPSRRARRYAQNMAMPNAPCRSAQRTSPGTPPRARMVRCPLWGLRSDPFAVT